MVSSPTDGSVPPGNRFGLAAVAQHAGVSVATVSNVLNRPEIVATKTKRRVLASMAALDFVPNRAAATLRQGINRLIGLVVPDITNPFYAEIARGVSDAAYDAGYAVALCVTNDDAAREGRHLAMLAEQRASGALVVPISADHTRLRQLRAVGGRLVLVDRLAAADEGCAAAIDDVHGGFLAVDHLLRGGRGRLAIINGSPSITQCANRRSGAHRAMLTHNRDPNSLAEHEVVDMSINEGRDLAHRMADSDLPDGVFCINDLLAAGVVLGLHDRGVRVPEDVAVVGYGDLDPATHGIIDLTTIEQPKQDLGRAAMRMLLVEIDEATETHRHSTVLYTPRLIVRDSAP